MKVCSSFLGLLDELSELVITIFILGVIFWYRELAKMTEEGKVNMNWAPKDIHPSLCLNV